MESEDCPFLARGESHFPSSYHLLEIKILFQTNVLNISDYVMCPAQKGSQGRHAAEVREEMRNGPELHDQRLLSNQFLLVL
jgi:hypothetical protein